MLLSHYSQGLIGFNKVSESSSAQILGRDGLIWLLWIQGEVNVDDLLGLEAALFDQSVVSVDLIDHLQVEWVVVAHLERVFLEDCLCVLPYGILYDLELSWYLPQLFPWEWNRKCFWTRFGWMNKPTPPTGLSNLRTWLRANKTGQWSVWILPYFTLKL